MPPPRSTPVRVVLNADDFGISSAVDEGILGLLAQGRLSALSVMSAAPLWKADGSRLAPFRHNADIGLHFSLTEIPPLRPTGLRRSDGSPKSFGEVQTAAWRRQLDRAAILDELHLQWQAFVAVLGQPPAHIDSHQHVHQLPVVREALLDFLDGLAPGERPYVRTAVDRAPTILRRGVNPGRALAFAFAGARLRRELLRRRVRTNDGFSGVYDFRAGRYPGLFRRFLRGARDTTIVLCHPAIGPAHPDDPIAAARRQEFEYLSSETMADDLAAAGVAIGRFAP
jgi:predicted glycoside hydrolase/deacetylase ChbG (UPF0249 family)